VDRSWIIRQTSSLSSRFKRSPVERGETYDFQPPAATVCSVDRNGRAPSMRTVAAAAILARDRHPVMHSPLRFCTRRRCLKIRVHAACGHHHLAFSRLRRRMTCVAGQRSLSVDDADDADKLYCRRRRRQHLKPKQQQHQCIQHADSRSVVRI